MKYGYARVSTDGQSLAIQISPPLRPGRTPGYRKRPLEDIDRVLHECDWLAREILPPNSS